MRRARYVPALMLLAAGTGCFSRGPMVYRLSPAGILTPAHCIFDSACRMLNSRETPIGLRARS
jgi:hypothetical protein